MWNLTFLEKYSIIQNSENEILLKTAKCINRKNNVNNKNDWISFVSKN